MIGGLGDSVSWPARRRETVGTGRGRGRRRVVFVVCGMEERVTDVMYSFLFLFLF